MPKPLEQHEDIHGERVLDPGLDIVVNLPAAWTLRPHADHVCSNQQRLALVEPLPFLGRRLDRERIVEAFDNHCLQMPGRPAGGCLHLRRNLRRITGLALAYGIPAHHDDGTAEVDEVGERPVLKVLLAQPVPFPVRRRRVFRHAGILLSSAANAACPDRIKLTYASAGRWILGIRL